MNFSPSFTVYNASAGSGKTFALVKAYLKLILMHPQRGYYKHLLALTFTNKAVAEMKERIVTTLSALCEDAIPKGFQEMQQLLMDETSLNENEIKERSKNVLKHLLHHYAQFSIETIDGFNHRLIRTFAHDLKLASHFEVSLDTEELLSKAVDQFIEKAGEDPEITELLLEFALQKTDEDKSWDISFDLKKTASLLANENDRWHLNALKEKSISNFKSLQKELRDNIKTFEVKITEEASGLLKKLEEEGIPQEVFQRGTFPNHFKKLSAGDYDVYKNKLEENIELGGSKLYKSQTPDGVQQDIDSLNPYFLTTYRNCRTKVYQINLYKNILKNLVPLATLNGLNQEIETIKEEENILPISEFNSLIFSEIKDQPAPFIYERLGDRYRHFFIDEFQDTSQLQWNNLIPLIDNALSQTTLNDETGSLLLVGDAKQSIYRWRGGLPEQFMELSENKNPFTAAQKSVMALDTNYRSTREIINFNNGFFSYVSNIFENPGHTSLYESGSNQKHTQKDGGYIKLEFIDAQNKEEEHEVYPQKVYGIIKDALNKGYEAKDICILTRRKKDGIAISEYLLEEDPTLPIVSEETLLLKKSGIVLFLVNLLQLTLEPKNEEIKIQVLAFLHAHLKIEQEKHDFYLQHLSQPLSLLSKTLEESKGISFHFDMANRLPLFESLEYCIESLQLAPHADGFVSSFMDLVFRFSQSPKADKVDFISQWEVEKEKASLTSNKDANAIKLMTIHKSKGLEFPVVIFPYADVNLYTEIDPKSWLPWNENGFDYLLIDYKKELENYGELEAAMVKQRRETQELDNINLLYVALTRAERELYILAKNEPLKDVFNTYNSLLKGYVASLGIFEEGKESYDFGTPYKATASKPSADDPLSYLPYTVTSPKSHNLNIVTSTVVDIEERSEAIDLGNRFHDYMAKIETTNDLEGVLQELESLQNNNQESTNQLIEMIRGVVLHPELQHLFKDPYKVYNEREVATPNKMVRPDRIVIHSNGNASIIDYKTGKHNPKYVEQIYEYSDAMEAMGYKVKEKLLVYCNTDGILINKN